MQGRDVLRDSLGSLLSDLSVLDDRAGWRPTHCAGWCARDLVFHLLGDAQRALVALHTPAAGPSDVDAVSYWRGWQPATPGADAGRRGTRIMASAWSVIDPLIALYAETAQAVLVAVEERSDADLVVTQGHVLTVGDLCSTLAVEATVHHLDLELGAPSHPGLHEVRRVLDGLLGRPAPISDDKRYALIGTGRLPLSAEEQTLLGADAASLPLFG
jgi:hypothetical protein